MISTQGMSSMMALSLIDRERETFENGIKNDVVAKREIASFRERIGSITSVEDLQADYQVYSFVMKTFGLGDKLADKAFNEQLMTADPEDRTSLVRRLTNPAFLELNTALGFNEDGEADGRFTDQDWVDNMVEAFVDRRLIDTQMETRESVGIALEFERKADSLTSWYKVLGDSDIASFMRVSLGIPESVGTADLDAQVRLFESKMDIEDLQDPEVRKDLTRKYAAISDANDTVQMAQNSAVQLLSAATNSGTWSIVTLDIDLVSGFRSPTSYR